VPFGGLLTAGLIGAGGSIISGLFGASSATKAAQAQTAEEDKALQFQEQEYSDQKANQAPFISAGQSSMAQLMAGFQNGTFGPGSTGPVPAFTAPTLAQAQQTPGYQFTQQQGEQGIERGAAAAGGAVTGGTLKALASYDTGLANSTYNTIYQQALSGYGASMSTYQEQLAAQQQAFSQLSNTASIGESASANAGSTGAQAANTVGSTLSSIGNSTSAGIVGSSNAITGAISGATSAATLPIYLQSLGQAQLTGINSQVQSGINNQITGTQANLPLGSADYLGGG
jgi:hypothetical protein